MTLKLSTQKKYKEIVQGADRVDLIKWIHERVDSQTPAGTALPLRAAVKHYLVSQGYTSDEVEVLLPSAGGRKAGRRDPLTSRQLASYFAAVEQVQVEPARTILDLLPRTGLKISEICGLHVQEVEQTRRGVVLHIPGRSIQLDARAERVLLDYLGDVVPMDWVFPSNRGTPISGAAIRKYTRKLAASYPELDGLTPAVLRHTYAVIALKSGMDLLDLQRILGHKSRTSTERYLEYVRKK